LVKSQLFGQITIQTKIGQLVVWLVVSTPLKNMKVGMIIPNIWKVIKFMFQTTNQLLVDEITIFFVA
jgi:hypothetical protein